MNLKITYLLVLMALTGCTEFAMLSSIGGVAVSHNAYAKGYSGLDFLTIINTDKDIKTYLYNNMKEDK